MKMVKRSPLLMLPVFFGAALLCTFSSVGAKERWDSRNGTNPTRPTHTLITAWALDELKNTTPELNAYREAVIDGANAEMHELETTEHDIKLGNRYGLDLKAKRVQHRGTNAGCDDIEGWWEDSYKAYKANNKRQAYFVLGILLHMVEDMGVPAHANNVFHQASLQFDNFEFVALKNWKPKFNDINKTDPGYADPYKYYYFSQKWTQEDAPNYRDRDSFPKFWATASEDERALVSNRQGRTCHVAKWTLSSALAAFAR